MERYPAMKIVVAHGKASWMQEVLEKMEASTRVIPLLHHYPVSTEPEEMWEHGNVMLGFDAEERSGSKQRTCDYRATAPGPAPMDDRAASPL